LLSIEVAYTMLKDQAQGLALELSSREKAPEAFYNQVVPFNQELLKVMAFQVSLWGKIAAIRIEFATTREETQHFQTKLKALKKLS
jgi:hypothetical protein